MSLSESSFSSYDLFGIATLILKMMILIFKLMSQKKTEKGAINFQLK